MSFPFQFFSSCSGADGRNRSVIQWLCIEEHSCSVGGDVVWGKVQGFAWWPAQHYFRSGIEIIRKKVEAQTLSTQIDNHKSAVSKLTKTPLLVEAIPVSSESTMVSLSIQTQGASVVYLCFFLEDTHLVMSIKEAKATVVPFNKRNKEVKSGMGKRLNTAYSLAIMELEEQRSALCACQYLPTTFLEAYGGFGESINRLLNIEFIVYLCLYVYLCGYTYLNTSIIILLLFPIIYS